MARQKSAAAAGDSITVAPARTPSDREYHAMRDGEIHLIINTPSGRKPKNDDALIRAGAVQYKHTLHDDDLGRPSRSERHRDDEEGRFEGEAAAQDYYKR